MKFEKYVNPIMILLPPDEQGDSTDQVKIDFSIVRFSSHQNPFKMLELPCNSPLCICWETVLLFLETNEEGKATENPIVFSFILDLEQWNEKRPSKNPEICQQFVDEFLTDLSAEMKTTFRKNYERNKDMVREAAKFTVPMPELEEDRRLIPFCEVVSTDGGVMTGINSSGFGFAYKDTAFVIEELYCSNPECDCNSVHLVFNQDTEKGLSFLFTAEYNFDGVLKIKSDAQCSKKMARKIFGNWKNSEPAVLNLLKHRYHIMKEEGKKIFPETSIEYLD